MMSQAFGKPELPDIQRLRLRDGPDDRVKRLGVDQRVDAVSATCEPDNSVPDGRSHAGISATARRGPRQKAMRMEDGGSPFRAFETHADPGFRPLFSPLLSVWSSVPGAGARPRQSPHTPTQTNPHDE